MGRRSGFSQRDIKNLLNHPYLIPPSLGGGIIFFGVLIEDSKVITLGIILLIILSIIVISFYYYIAKENRIRVLAAYRLNQERIELERKRIERLGRTGLQYIDGMNGYEFEEFLYARFLSMGYKVTHTSNSGDFGIDLVLEKDNSKIGVQAKRYTNNVPYKAIQEAYSGKNFYGCNEAWVVTTANDFTKQAKVGANQLDIRLFTKDDLAELLEKID